VSKDWKESYKFVRKIGVFVFRHFNWSRLDTRHSYNGKTRQTRALTFWRWNYFFNFSTPCIQNVNNTGTKEVSIMNQTAF